EGGPGGHGASPSWARSRGTGRGAGARGCPVRRRVQASRSSLRITATITTSAGLPLARRRSANVRRREGAPATSEELRASLAPRVARLWLPDAFVFTDQIPRTAAGKLLKSALREQYKTYQLQPA